jgi:hypothetical protein
VQIQKKREEEETKTRREHRIWNSFQVPERERRENIWEKEGG